MATIYILQDKDDESSGDLNRQRLSGLGLGIGKNGSNLPSLTTNQPTISVVQSITTTVKPFKSRTSVSRSGPLPTDLQRSQSTGTKPLYSVARSETTSKTVGNFHSKERDFSQYEILQQFWNFIIQSKSEVFRTLLNNVLHRPRARLFWETRFCWPLPTAAILTNFWFLVAFSSNCLKGGHKNIETHLHRGLVGKYLVQIVRTNIYWNTGQSAREIKIERIKSHWK